MNPIITPGLVRDINSVAPRQVSSGVMAHEIVPAGSYAEALFAEQIEMSQEFAKDLSEINYLIECKNNDVYFYVLAGSGEVEFDRKKIAIKEGCAAMFLAGESATVTTDSSLSLVLIYVPGPTTPWARRLVTETDLSDRIVVTRLGEADKQSASSEREFEILFDKNRASRGATMFVGFIPTSGAPEHYHLYDEICMIVGGIGGLNTRDHEFQKLRKGSAFHIAPRYLHAIHNESVEDVWILGVFRPEGSPSAAYYPDGRSAPNNVEDH